MTIIDFWGEEKAMLHPQRCANAPFTTQKTPCCHCEAAGKGVKFLVQALKQPKQSLALSLSLEIATGGHNEKTNNLTPTHPPSQ